MPQCVGEAFQYQDAESAEEILATRSQEGTKKEVQRGSKDILRLLWEDMHYETSR